MFPTPNSSMNQPNRRPAAPNFQANQPGAPNQNGQAPDQMQNRYQSGMMPQQPVQEPGGEMGGTPPWGSGSASTGLSGVPGGGAPPSERPQYQGAPPPVARQQMAAPQAYQRQAMSQQVPQQRKLTPPQQ